MHMALWQMCALDLEKEEQKMGNAPVKSSLAKRLGLQAHLGC